MTCSRFGVAGEVLEGDGAAPTQRRPVPGGRRQIASRELFSGFNELWIEHNGEIYTLRLTSKGKLILTK